MVAYAVQNGIPVPTFSAAVAYYDSYRAAVLPANLIQAQQTTSVRIPTNALIKKVCSIPNGWINLI